MNDPLSTDSKTDLINDLVCSNKVDFLSSLSMGLEDTHKPKTELTWNGRNNNTPEETEYTTDKLTEIMLLAAKDAGIADRISTRSNAIEMLVDVLPPQTDMAIKLSFVSDQDMKNAVHSAEYVQPLSLSDPDIRDKLTQGVNKYQFHNIQLPNIVYKSSADQNQPPYHLVATVISHKAALERYIIGNITNSIDEKQLEQNQKSPDPLASVLNFLRHANTLTVSDVLFSNPSNKDSATHKMLEAYIKPFIRNVTYFRHTLETFSAEEEVVCKVHDNNDEEIDHSYLEGIFNNPIFMLTEYAHMIENTQKENAETEYSQAINPIQVVIDQNKPNTFKIRIVDSDVLIKNEQVKTRRVLDLVSHGTINIKETLMHQTTSAGVKWSKMSTEDEINPHNGQPIKYHSYELTIPSDEPGKLTAQERMHLCNIILSIKLHNYSIARLFESNFFHNHSKEMEKNLTMAALHNDPQANIYSTAIHLETFEHMYPDTVPAGMGRQIAMQHLVVVERVAKEALSGIANRIVCAVLLMTSNILHILGIHNKADTLRMNAVSLAANIPTIEYLSNIYDIKNKHAMQANTKTLDSLVQLIHEQNPTLNEDQIIDSPLNKLMPMLNLNISAKELENPTLPTPELSKSQTTQLNETPASEKHLTPNDNATQSPSPTLTESESNSTSTPIPPERRK